MALQLRKISSSGGRLCRCIPPVCFLAEDNLYPACFLRQEYLNDYGTEEEKRVGAEVIAREGEIGLSESAQVGWGTSLFSGYGMGGRATI
jgi:hypothetical protein